MKIEKINDNQIRCTLNKNDLASRHLKISELAYGSEKAKALFRDMMKQASYELGFESDDLPLMIEAIPVNSESIILIVTKVDDPEELDTRFSRFSNDENEDYDLSDDEYSDPFISDDELSQYYSDSTDDNADDECDDCINCDESQGSTISPSNTQDISDVEIPSSAISNDVMDLFNKVKNFIKDNEPKNDAPEVKQEIKIFSFETFDSFCDAAKCVKDLCHVRNDLYKDSNNNKYYLILNQPDSNISNIKDFTKCCNMLSEFGSYLSISPDSIFYYYEHFECLIKSHAVQTGATI